MFNIFVKIHGCLHERSESFTHLNFFHYLFKHAYQEPNTELGTIRLEDFSFL